MHTQWNVEQEKSIQTRDNVGIYVTRLIAV